ncbi:MAG TPA: MMPL family transporter [Pirellulales bacterium]|nr:MMPL family transporter [Pirellulales bacterium]
MTRSPPVTETSLSQNDPGHEMYQRLAKFVSRWWVAVVVAWVVVAATVRIAAPRWDDVTHDGDLAYLPAETKSVRGENLLREAFPNHRAKSQMVIVCERADGPLTSDDRSVLVDLSKRLAASEDEDLPVVEVWSPWTAVVGKKLTSRDRHAALIVVLIRNEFMAVDNIRVLKRLQDVVDEARLSPGFPSGLRLEVTGSAAVGGDMLTAAQESIANTETATIILVVLILLLVYRAPVLVAIPMITIGVSVAVSLGLVAALTQARHLPGLEWLDFKVFKTTKIFVVVILFGSGTDFCLFLIARFKEELQRGVDRAQAVENSLANVGEALVGSAMTTILGLATMAFADFGKYRNSGPAIALCLAVTLLASLTLAPALLRALSRVVFWPFNPVPAAAWTGSRAEGVATSRLWQAISRGIIARPGLILLTSCLLMAPFAYRGWFVSISYDLLEELPRDRASVVGTDLLRKHFPAGEMAPITILAEKPGADFTSRASGKQIASLTKALFNIRGVDSVRSLSEPLGDKPGTTLSPKWAVLRHPRTKAYFLAQSPDRAGEVTRFDVISRYDAFSLQAADLLDRIDDRLQQLSEDETSDWYGTTFLYTGTTAGVRDLQAVTHSDQVLIQRLVVIAVLGVLIVILKRPLVCAYLIVTVLFSYLVTIGATELVFGTLYEPFSGLDWKVPLYLFVILTAVGEDYNIYLMTRVLEEQRQRGLIEGLRAAVVRTGGIITSCGVIMAGTFVSMTFGTLRAILELGFALSLGVLLDTLVVRPVLVPAFLALVYQWKQLAPQAALESPPDGEWVGGGS